MRTTFAFLTLAAAALLIGACRSPSGETLTDKQDDVRRMRTQVLNTLYADAPYAKPAIESSAGYAVFSNFGLKIFLLGSGNGYGIAVNNQSGDETFMKMFQLEGGLGLGAKNFSVVFFFDDEKALNDFIEQGWEFGADAEASAKHEETGGALEGATTVGRGVRMFQLTETGLSLQAAVGGTKYWKDDELNQSGN